MIATQNNKLNIVTQLLDNKAEVNAKNINGNTSLILAAQHNYPKIVTELLKNGADVNIQNDNGITALMDAAALGNLEIIKILLDNHANINITDKKGNYVFSYAAIKINKENQINIIISIYREFDDRNLIFCSYCRKNNPEYYLFMCGGCYSRLYCNQECQRNDWSEHKKRCKM
jgi:ankyrin repeat protein